MQIVELDGTALTPWFRENAVVAPQTASSCRLSGNAMQNYIYFATSQGNATLHCSEQERHRDPASYRVGWRLHAQARHITPTAPLIIYHRGEAHHIQ